MSRRMPGGTSKSHRVAGKGLFVLGSIGVLNLLQRQRRVSRAAMERVATNPYSAVPLFSE